VLQFSRTGTLQNATPPETVRSRPIVTNDRLYRTKRPALLRSRLFEIYQGFQLPNRLPCRVPTFLYRCPNTALNVQGRVADDPIEGEAETYEPITCTACARVHLINPKTGKVLGLTKIRPPSRRGYWELVKEMGPRKRKKLLGR